MRFEGSSSAAIDTLCWIPASWLSRMMVTCAPAGKLISWRSKAMSSDTSRTSTAPGSPPAPGSSAGSPSSPAAATPTAIRANAPTTSSGKEAGRRRTRDPYATRPAPIRMFSAISMAMAAADVFDTASRIREKLNTRIPPNTSPRRG
jgi:hypothetical protein